MKVAVYLLAAASALRFDVTDARGKKAAGVLVDGGEADADGWRAVSIVRSKKDDVIVCPFDARAASPDTPEPVPVLVVERGDTKALANPALVAAIVTGAVLGVEPIDGAAARTGFDAGALKTAVAGLATASEDYAWGVGLLWAAQPAKAAEALAAALRERERRLTRVPSEIYPAAILYGKALFDSGKYDDAAVAYLKALKLRPSDTAARQMRAAALIKAGKEDAARQLLGTPP
jgi:hypothetical protein